MLKNTILVVTILTIAIHAQATILHVGSGHPYPTLQDAAEDVAPGDTIRVHEGAYAGGIYISNLQGTADDWIIIEAADGEVVTYDGGTNAWQFSDPAYLVIKGFIFQGQTGNGVNFDDGGSYSTPGHHIHFFNCTFREINATGNNDLLKMSGIDFFEIRNCTFYNGSYGGSGLDMVGCHDGVISHNHFENQGSNAIQAKGGTARILIENNLFKYCGQRALNLGGSTGLEFFRPFNAPYEAAELNAYANVFIGSVAPVAFVGSVNCEVINNTMYRPEKWALRILQETVDTTRFLPCGDNTFSNNIIVMDDRVTTECNIGPNTDPTSFTMSNNFWLQLDEFNWPGPELPVTDPNIIVQQDPLFMDPENDNFDLEVFSPAIHGGLDVPEPTHDYLDRPYNTPRSIGAYEGDVISAVHDIDADNNLMSMYPMPASDYCFLEMKENFVPKSISLYSIHGQLVQAMKIKPVSGDTYYLPMQAVPSGNYVVRVGLANDKVASEQITIQK
jgi:hypothetical protein